MPRTRRWILRMRYRMRCANGHESTTHLGSEVESTDEGYDPRHGSTPWDEMAELNAYQNPVYAEVQHLVQELRGHAPDRRNCFHRVLGAACDPAPSGHRYRFAGRAQRRCLVCGQKAEEFTPVFSGEGDLCKDRVEVPLATHREWEGLSGAEKRERLRVALESVRCLPPNDLVEATRYWVRCAAGHEGITHEFGQYDYGRRDGRTAQNELAEFDTFRDPVFDEVVQLVKELRGHDHDYHDCFDQVLGEACDPAPSGHQYSFISAYKGWCPVCGQKNVVDAGSVRVRDTVEIPWRSEWDSLRLPEKRARLRAALQEPVAYRPRTNRPQLPNGIPWPFSGRSGASTFPCA